MTFISVTSLPLGLGGRGGGGVSCNDRSYTSRIARLEVLQCNDESVAASVYCPCAEMCYLANVRVLTLSDLISFTDKSWRYRDYMKLK